MKIHRKVLTIGLGVIFLAVATPGVAAPPSVQDHKRQPRTTHRQTIAAQAQPAAPVRTEAAGTPGVPQAPTTVVTEDFEANPAPQPIRLPSYAGVAPTNATYTADPAWLSNCNGWVLSSGNSAGYAPGIADCGDVVRNWDGVRDLANVLGQFGGGNAAANHAVTAFSAANPGPDKVQFETVTPISLPGPNRFITFSVDSAAVACDPIYAHPELKFYLMDGATAIPTFTTPINPCTDPRSSTYPTTIGLDAKVVRAPGDRPVLFAGTQVGIRLVNGQGAGNGNDASFDNIKILDVTPQVDKAFSPVLASSIESSTLTFTITNTNDLLAKPGWSFTDNLPAGMTVADPLVSSTTCTNGAVAVAGVPATSVLLSGDLNAGQASCTLSVNVVAPKGTYRNCDTNVTNMIGVNPPACAEVEFDDPKYSSVKSSDPAPGTTVLPGETVTYTLKVKNDGRVPVTPTITDDLTGVIDDAQYNDDAAVAVGTLSYAEPILTWTGRLDPGATTEITYTVTVDKPIGGDFSMRNKVITKTPGGNCMPDSPCVHDVPLPKYVVHKSSDPASGTVANGQKVTYTITVENTGKVEFAPSITDNISGILDDANYNNDAAADIGNVTYASPKIDWTGSIPVGGKATITYSVTVTAKGDNDMDNVVRGNTPSGNCPVDKPSGRPTEAVLLEPDITDPGCRTHLTAVLVPVTGAKTGQIMALGAFFVLAGAGLLIGVRRRSAGD